MHTGRIHLSYWAVIAVSVITAVLFTRSQVDAPSDTSVYLIGAVTITDPLRLPQYQAIAGPLAGKIGGYKPLAYAAPQMIEGSVPTAGFYFVERYDSLAGLQAFVDSSEFKQAKILRDQVADVHFMMWLPALAEGALPH